MKNKRLFYLFSTLFLLLIFTFTFSSFSYGADPKIVSTIKKAFETIESWIIKLATPAAAVAVCTGLFMKKFSFGDEERIRTGNKLVRNSLFSYAFILSIDLVLKAISSLVNSN